LIELIITINVFPREVEVYPRIDSDSPDTTFSRDFKSDSVASSFIRRFKNTGSYRSISPKSVAPSPPNYMNPIPDRIHRKKHIARKWFAAALPIRT